MKLGLFTRRIGVVCLLVTLGALLGCGGANGDSIEVADKRADGESMSSDDKAAADFLRAKLEEHWLKGPDGWTTQYQMVNIMGQVVPDRQPNELYKQFKRLSFTVSPETLTESMKLNGTDYRVIAHFQKTPERWFRLEAGYEGPKGWANWEDGGLTMTTVAIERRNGNWILSDSDLFTGVRPDAAAVPSKP